MTHPKIKPAVIKAARRFALAESKKYHGSLELFQLSYDQAEKIAKKLKANVGLALIGAYFMDLKLDQALKKNRVKDHIAMGLKAAKEFFKKHKIDDKTEELVLNCIAAHHKGIPYKSLEAEICANADCYKFLHPKGLFIYLTRLGARSSNFGESIKQAEKKLEEKHKILSLEICKNELRPYYHVLKHFLEISKR